MIVHNYCSAADLYIKDYIDPYVDGGQHPDAMPLRIVYRHRWTRSMHPTVLKYCLLNKDPSVPGSFRVPVLDEIMKYRVVVATLSTSRQLFDVGVSKGVCVCCMHEQCMLLNADVLHIVDVSELILKFTCIVFIRFDDREAYEMVYIRLFMCLCT